MRLRRRRPWPLRLAFGLTVAGLVLLLCELGLRLAGLSPPYEADAIGGWRLLPEMHHQVMHGTREVSSFTVTTNADGLRTTLSRARTPGLARVALLGDSTVFGWGVDDGGTVADGLAAQLAADGVAAEVLDAGQPGYSTTQIAELYTKVVAAYQPDLAVVFVPMHDDNRVLVSDREHLDGGRGLAAIRVFLAQNSRLYQLFRQSLTPLAHEAVLVPGREQSAEPRVPRVSDAERTDNLDRIRTSLARSGGRLVVGHLPFLGDLVGAEDARNRYSVPWALAYSQATGTPILDLRDCCVGLGGAALTQPNDPGHLTAEGNLLVGHRAAPAIEAWLTGG